MGKGKRSSRRDRENQVCGTNCQARERVNHCTGLQQVKRRNREGGCMTESGRIVPNPPKKTACILVGAMYVTYFRSGRYRAG